MRLHRFFSKDIIHAGSVNHLSDFEVVHQLRRVFRLHEGDKAIFFDGTGNDYVSEIVSMTGDAIDFKVEEARVVKPHSPLRLTLAVSLIKKDNFEWVVQKCTELGVSGFIPLISERSEKKSLNMERARKIMIEAVEQSGRSFVPEIKEPIELEEYLNTEKREMAAFHTGDKEKIKKFSRNVDNLVALIGPEGGWSQKEVEMFEKKGVKIMSLDTPVLRAETAAVAISAILLLR
jgi:16S rRNA (uracil1498-N3)-methyltransferase